MFGALRIYISGIKDELATADLDVVKYKQGYVQALNDVLVMDFIEAQE